MPRSYTLAELSRATGIAAGTLRRLLPARRAYGPADRLRVESIRALRDAGLALPDIRRALRAASPRAVLTIHLSALDHQRARVGRAAAAVRAALDRRGLDVPRLERRLDAQARASTIERRERLAHVIAGAAIADFGVNVVEAAFRDLPDHLSDAQWKALLELVDLLEQPAITLALRDDRRWWWVRAQGRFDVASWRKLLDDLVSQAHGAWVRHDPPTGRRGRVLSARWVNHAASLQRVSMHAAALDLIERAETQDPELERVWELVATVRGWPSPPPHIVAFRWLLEAVRAHIERFRGKRSETG